jgi:RNA polymerase sigma-70 factor (ECF subfamily)
MIQGGRNQSPRAKSKNDCGAGFKMSQKGDLFQKIEAATPALRRYARALCCGAGSAAADELVQAAIEQAAAKVRARESSDGATARHCAYRALTALAREKCAGLATTASPRQPAVVHALADLPYEERASLLLVALEGFSYEAAARIADTSREAFVARLMRARAALSLLDLRPSAPSDGARRAGGHLRVVK